MQAFLVALIHSFTVAIVLWLVATPRGRRLPTLEIAGAQPFPADVVGERALVLTEYFQGLRSCRGRSRYLIG